MLLEIGQLLFDFLLLFCESGIGGAVVGKYFALKVISFVYLALITVHCEIIVRAHGRCVVVVASC